MSIDNGNPRIILPAELESFVDSDRISANKNNYREFDWNPDRHEQKALDIVRENLLGIDLSHATASNPESIASDGILPFADLASKQDWRSQTFALDRSLGLHHYTFLHWGAFHPTQNGRYVIPVSGREILLSPKTIATPHDINETMYRFMENDAQALEGQARQFLDGYLDSIVSGSDWVDIVARRSLKHMMQTRNPDVYRIRNHKSMGEIKHYGVVQPSLLGETIDVRDEEAMHPLWRSMIDDNGVAVSYVTNAIEAEERGHSGSDKDKLPHEIGANIEKSRKLWRTILDIAQKS